MNDNDKLSKQSLPFHFKKNPGNFQASFRNYGISL